MRLGYAALCSGSYESQRLRICSPSEGMKRAVADPSRQKQTLATSHGLANRQPERHV